MFNHQKFEQDLETFVNIESGSYDVEGVIEANNWLANRFIAAGWDVTWFWPTIGPKSNSFIAHKGEITKLDVLLMGHTDTVFEKGDTPKNPFRKTEDGAHYMGLGADDMKSGCLYALHIAEEMIKEVPEQCSKIAFLFNGQEEVSSIGTREFIEQYARLTKYALSLEPARANGACVKQRKGVSRYKITFTGLAAHSGVNHQDGESAVLEMAHWITYLEGLTDYNIGLTLNCGVAKGGTKANTVAASAILEVDVRSVKKEDAIAVDRKIHDKVNNKVNSKIDVVVEGGITRPPMFPTEESEKLCDYIIDLGKNFGLNIQFIATGGGSDVTFAADLGVISLDGLGPVGGKGHTYEEYICIHELDTRYELLKQVCINLTK